MELGTRHIGQAAAAWSWVLRCNGQGQRQSGNPLSGSPEKRIASTNADRLQWVGDRVIISSSIQHSYYYNLPSNITWFVSQCYISCTVHVNMQGICDNAFLGSCMNGCSALNVIQEQCATIQLCVVFPHPTHRMIHADTVCLNLLPMVRTVVHTVVLWYCRTCCLPHH
jgi:hypothetical protein